MEWNPRRPVNANVCQQHHLRAARHLSDASFAPVCARIFSLFPRRIIAVHITDYLIFNRPTAQFIYPYWVRRWR